MNIIYHILILFLLLYPQDDPYYNKRKPSSWGIEQYVSKNHDVIINEFEYLINDTLFDVYIYTDDLSDYDEENNLGIFYIPDEIMITTEEKYVEYEFKNLSKIKRIFSSYTERTVKAVIFHELTHAYFHQLTLLRNINNEYVSPEYANFNIFPSRKTYFGSLFIEEGICEYIVYSLNESAPLGDILIPRTEEELLDENNKVNNLYHYSVYFLEDFLDEYGIKKGINILLSNRPPTYEEILKPELFFNRLIVN